jgi:plastocyanin
MRTSETLAAGVTGRNWARLAVAGAVLGGVALLTAACGGSGGSTPAGGSSGGSAPATTSSSGQAAGSTSGTQVTATLTEYKIALSTSTFTPGTYTFVAKNAGQVGHALEIDGPGVSGDKTGGLQPGASANLTVTLSAGTYDIFCPVPGHKSLGMDTKITVSGSGGAGGGSQGGATSAQTTSNSGGGGYGGY